MTDESRESDWLSECLARLPRARAAVFGDFGVDAYWEIDPDLSELSLETGRPVYRARSQRYGLGAAGNVAANLVALGVRSVAAIGLVGSDPFGELMIRMLRERGIDTQGLLACQPEWQTTVFTKPCIVDQEQNRIDLGTFNDIDEQTIEILARQLEQVASRSDVVILNQQLQRGVSTAAMIERLNPIIGSSASCRFIVDARHRAGLYRGAAFKLNARELVEHQGQAVRSDEPIELARVRALARALARDKGHPVFVTRGERGLVVADGDSVEEIPGIRVLGEVDPVGAGDTVVATLGAGLAVGCDALSAARLANIAAAVTVRKLKTTGTASAAEISAIGSEPDYVHLPELAEDPSRARHLPGTQIEIVRELAQARHPQHIVFDHDGTLSALREGWEAVMQSVMERMILGSQFASASDALRASVVRRVRELIDETTGIQTLRQMQHLLELVREFGCVPESEQMDIDGYKAAFLDELHRIVQERLARIRTGQTPPEDFRIKGALELLVALSARGTKLYLTSGTDTPEAIADAQALGYASLFEGRIFGATGNVRDEAKRELISALFREHALRGPEMVVFGDGPVEIREARRHGAIAVGVASDERHKQGLDARKRARLIRAGADLVISDYAESDALIELLWGQRSG